MTDIVDVLNGRVAYVDTWLGSPHHISGLDESVVKEWKAETMRAVVEIDRLRTELHDARWQIDAGYNDGLRCGRKEGYNDGLADGYKEGYDDGLAADGSWNY